METEMEMIKAKMERYHGKGLVWILVSDVKSSLMGCFFFPCFSPISQLNLLSLLNLANHKTQNKKKIVYDWHKILIMNCWLIVMTMIKVKWSSNANTNDSDRALYMNHYGKLYRIIPF